jgi:hypothetical protein
MRDMLFQLELDKRDPRVQRDLEDVHELHRSVWSMFGRCLWVIDRQAAKLTVRHNSGVGIQLTPGYVRTAKCEIEDYSDLAIGDVVGFALAAVPTKKVGTALKNEREAGIRRNGRRVPVDPVEWLRTKLHDNGCELVDLESITRETAHGTRRGSLLTFAGVRYTGWLRIKNIDQLLHSLVLGIGPAKGYGYGLLLLDMRSVWHACVHD